MWGEKKLTCEARRRPRQAKPGWPTDQAMRNDASWKRCSAPEKTSEGCQGQRATGPKLRCQMAEDGGVGRGGS